MSVFGSLLGSEYSLRFNAVIGGVALIAIYLAARLYLRPEWALGSAVALGITMPMMYFSRDMYTEPLAILMTWTTLLFFVSAFKHRNIKSLWVVAGAMLGATALSRIDAGLFIAGIFAGVLFVQFATKQTVAIRRGILLSVVASLPLVGLAMYDLWRYSRLYLINHSEEIILQYLAVVVLVGVVLVTALIGPRTERLLSQLRGMLANPKLYAIGGVVLAICILGLWMRPYVASQEYSHQNEYVKQVESANGIDETGVTNYSRYSIEWVGWYLGEVILVLGAIGLIALLASRLIHHRASEVLLVTIIGTAGWYLYSPSITPDQVWASRRFLVVLIPGLIICAMMVLSFVAQKLLPIRYRQVYIAGGFLFAVLPILMSAKPLLQDQRLMLHTEPMQQFCGSLPDNSAVLWLGMGRLEAVAPTRIMCDVPSAGFSNADRDTPDNPVKRDLQQYARSLREQGYTPVIAVFEENLYTLSEAEVNIANLNRITERDYAVLKPTIFGAPRDLWVVDSAIYAARVMDDGSLEAINR